MRVKLPKFSRKLKFDRRHPSFKVPAITFGVLLVACSAVYILARGTDKLPPVNDANIVIVSHDDQEQIVPSKSQTVGSLLSKLDIKLNEGDIVEPALASRINQDQFRVNVYRAKPVQIVDGGSTTFAFSASKTPRAIAQQSGAVLYPEDDITAEPVQDFIKQGAIGEQVVVKRATPIEVDLYGTKVTLRTQAKTVAGLIKEKNIRLIKDDKVVPAPETAITPGQQVAFLRTGTKTETVSETIATPVQTINDGSLAYGTKAVRQQGAPGQQTVTYEIAITNNVETSRKIIQKVVTKEPVTQVEVMGTSISGIKGDMARAGIAPGDYQYVDYIVSHESGWRPNAAPRGISGPYGLCQANPGTKMSSAGGDWQTNPVTQLRWCAGYAQSRYGSWAAAYNYWLSHRYW